jgi:hypothetical protein
MPERQRVRVLAVTRGNTYLEAALLLDEYLNVTVLAPKQFPPKGSYDVTVFDGVVPSKADRATAALYLDPPAEGSPVPLGRDITMFGFDTWDRKSPLLRWMALRDIQVLDGHTFRPTADDKVVASSELGPLLVQGRRGDQRFVALSFDPKRSDFVLRVGWPLFLLNTIRHFVEQDTGFVSSYPTGDVWQLRVPQLSGSATLTDPTGQTLPIRVQDGRIVHFGEHAGFYRIASTKSPRDTTLFAANLASPEESHIAPRTELKLAGKKARPLGPFTAGIRRELWLYLLLCVVLLSLLEWVTYHRRVSV